MPLQTKANDVNQRYLTRTNASIERLVVEELGAVRKLFAHVLERVEEHVDAHFERQHAAGEPPYVENKSYGGGTSYEARIAVPIDEAHGAPLADEKVVGRLREKIGALLKANGFNAYASFAEGQKLTVALSDPEYRPTLYEDHLVATQLEARLKAQRD